MVRSCIQVSFMPHKVRSGQVRSGIPPHHGWAFYLKVWMLHLTLSVSVVSLFLWSEIKPNLC